MSEGQELLLKILESKLITLNEFDKDEIMCDGINLVELTKSIEDNMDNFARVSDDVIDYIVKNTSAKSRDVFKNNARKVRDLLIGKRDYKLKIEMTNEYKNVIKTFTKCLNKFLNDRVPGIVDLEAMEKDLRHLYVNIQNREIINDFDFIQDLVMDYNKKDFDANMVKVMKFINEHNLSILKSHKRNAPLFDINFIRRPKLNERVIEILNKLEINYKDLPNYLISELKKCDVDEIYNTYNILKQNKAEDGGLLHLIKKDNYLARLVLVLYASETSIKSVLNSIKDSKKNIDINILKVLLNNIITCFLSKNNEYFKPKYEDFIKNMTLLKELNINYKSLITKTPIFLITSNEVLEYTLKYLEKYGADKKLVINRCYKTLATKPSLLIENVDILSRYNVDLKEYFGENNKNYNLIKTTNLEEYIVYILKNVSKVNPDKIDYNIINKYIINKICRESLDRGEL